METFRGLMKIIKKFYGETKKQNPFTPVRNPFSNIRAFSKTISFVTTVQLLDPVILGFHFREKPVSLPCPVA